MGQNPTDSQVNDMVNEVPCLSFVDNLVVLKEKMYLLQIDVDGSGNIEFDQFVSFALRLFSQEGDHEREVMEMFRR